MQLPGWKTLVAVGGTIIVSNFAGPKLAAKFMGPEIDGQGGGAAALNTVKEYGAIVGVGLVTYVVLTAVFKV